MFWVLLAGSLAGLGLGVLVLMAGGMSDNPEAGDQAGKWGMISCLISLIVIVLACVARHNHWLPI